MPKKDATEYYIGQYYLENNNSDNKWVIAFSDLISLILTFFVLIFSMSTLDDQAKWEDIASSLSQKLNPEKETTYTEASENYNIDRVENSLTKELTYLKSVITDKFNDNKDLLQLFQVDYRDNSMILSAKFENIFKYGSVELNKNASYAFSILGEALANLNNKISIYGNTPIDYIDDSKFASAVELSIIRADAVSKLLRSEGYRYNMALFGRNYVATNNLEEFSGEESEIFLQSLDIVISGYSAKE